MKPKLLRCAIYTRKSSEEGLDQAFNSLHAQREACEAYIKSQAHEGWRPVDISYDDGGYSGGSMERPALKRLLEDVEHGKVDVIVVYKVDRLTRSLVDFAKIVETLDAKRVSFVSITQQFNTTSSMGRLTLNVLLSFAQFEREVTGERIRDKIAASRRKGMWMGGFPPLGYDILNRKLAVNAKEAEQVRGIFRRFLELGSIAALAKDLRERGIASKRWKTRKGTMQGGHVFSRGALYHLLRNRAYRGEAVHKDEAYKGEHESIVPKTLWDQVQAKLAPVPKGSRRARREKGVALLTGFLFDDRGNLMSPSHATKRNGKRYRYYVSQAILQYRKDQAGSLPRVSAAAIEAFVDDQLKALFQSDGQGRANAGPANGINRLDLRGLVQRIEVGKSIVVLRLNRRPKPEHLSESGGNTEPKFDSSGVVIRIPVRLRAWGGETVIDTPVGAVPRRAYIDAALIRALGRAHQWRAALLSSKALSLDDIATTNGCTNRYVRRVLTLSFLSPQIVRAILNGAQPRSMTVGTMLARDLPLSWAKQGALLGFEDAAS